MSTKHMDHPKNLPSLNKVIEQSLGSFNWTQLLQSILVSLAWVCDGQQSFISVFSDAQPTWHCTNSDTCSSISSICAVPSSAWAWDGPESITIISQWSLQCASSFITGLPASSFFLGCLIGGLFLGTLADSSLGRKNLLLISCLTMSVAALVTTFSNNIWTYSALRFVSGFGRASIGTCALVLLTEKVSEKWRGRVGIMGFFFFTLGFLSLPLIAYINRLSSWRTLYLWTSIPGIFCCSLIHIFVTESPRWLFMHGRDEEAMEVLKTIGSATNDTDKSLTVSLLSFPHQQATQNHPKVPTSIYSSFKTLFGKTWAFKRIAGVLVLGIGIGLLYYGMPLGVGNLGFNIYLSVMFNALSEIPSYFVTFVLIENFNRKISILGLCLASGFCSIMSVTTEQKGLMQIGLELASFFSACTAYNMLLIYTTELFPTCVRNSATSLVREALVFGAVFSPLLVSAGRTNGIFSYGVFGFFILFCGLFVTLLPETRGAALCDTMDEQECKESAVSLA